MKDQGVVPLRYVATALLIVYVGALAALFTFSLIFEWIGVGVK